MLKLTYMEFFQKYFRYFTKREKNLFLKAFSQLYKTIIRVIKIRFGFGGAFLGWFWLVCLLFNTSYAFSSPRLPSVFCKNKACKCLLKKLEQGIKMIFKRSWIHLKLKYIVNHLHLLQALMPWLAMQEATCWFKIIWSHLRVSTSFSRTRYWQFLYLAWNTVVATSKYYIIDCYFTSCH